MSDWKAMSALPGLNLRSPIEAGKAAIVPRDDPRLIGLCEESKKLKSFLGRFTDAFGEKLEPAVIIVASDAPPTMMTREAIAGLRDAAALSMVIHNRSQALRYGHMSRPSYSNSFALYPWFIDNVDQHLTIHTPGMLGTHYVRKFKGQCAPEVSVADVGELDFDVPLLSELMIRWASRFSTKKPSYEHRVLFRSLNMANQASLIPGGSDATFYDYGRIVGLWISAFEILAHPQGADVGYKQVYDMLKRAEWTSRKLVWRRWVAPEGKKKKKVRCSLPVWLCNHLYATRNDFFHGNEVSVKTLMIKNSKSSLFQVAAPIYRMLLTTFLDLQWRGQFPPITNVDGFAEAIVDRMSFTSGQKLAEDAILASVGKFPRGITSRRRAGHGPRCR
ncbi:hypothetical protein PZB21_26030 [Rhizobium sp. CBK13]|uniref:hypothetical protein n=1 Tax=Rhizobium sp. CBK13 TaxID=3031399 RepID=UPI0023AF92AF|nr:hypothetical protein [Rhizobium sp. CBK13]MDE8762632.1 hypothetical protein [Rhizobium sp. CBK13]